MTEVTITGVLATMELGEVQVWGDISTSQNANWQDVAV
jgi:hypothetical protein